MDFYNNVTRRAYLLILSQHPSALEICRAELCLLFFVSVGTPS